MAYTKTTTRSRARSIIWCNLKKYFPRDHRLYKIFNEIKLHLHE